MTSSENRLLTLAGIASAVGALLSVVFFFGPVPCFDDWILVPLVDKLLEGRAVFGDFWALHNEHRLFFPKLILSYWAAWTHWELSGVAYLELFLLAGSTALLVNVGATDRGSFWKKQAFWAACIFTLSLRTTKVTLWPIMLSAYLCSTAVVSAFALVAQKPASLKPWAGAAFLCFIATFSFAGGLFSWFAAIPLFLLLKRGESAIKRPLLLWLGAGVITLALYFMGYHTTTGHPSAWLSLQTPIPYIHFFLVYIGSLFQPMPGAVFGAIGLFLAARIGLSAWKSRSANDAALLAVILFVIANGLATAAARLHFGPLAATSDRYLPISCFFWAAIAIHLVSRSAGRGSRLLLFLLLGCVLVLAPGHTQVAQRFRESHRWAETVLKKDSPSRGELEVIYYEPDRLPGYIEILKRRKLSVFR